MVESIILVCTTVLKRLEGHWVASNQGHLSEESCAHQEYVCLSFPATLSHCLEQLMGHVGSVEYEDGFKSSAAKTIVLCELRCEGHILKTSSFQVNRKICRTIQAGGKQPTLETEKPE